MLDLKVITDSKETVNWLKVHIALHFVRNILLDVVKFDMNQLHIGILRNARQANNLPERAACTKCDTNRVRSCATRICSSIQDEIKLLHRYSGPSWKNTDARKWCTTPWEIAKCFMPPSGYQNVSTPENTDFNGFINVVINCMEFNRMSVDVLSISQSVCRFFFLLKYILIKTIEKE